MLFRSLVQCVAMAASKTITINNLPLSCSEQDVQKVFSQFGQITSCQFQSSGGKEKFAFVNYTDAGSVSMAVQKMDSCTGVFSDQTKPIRVKEKQPKVTHDLILRDLPTTVRQEDLETICKKFGRVKIKFKTARTSNSMAMAYANFLDRKNAEAALYHLKNNYRPNGQHIKADWLSTQHSEAQPPTQHIVRGSSASPVNEPETALNSSIRVDIHTPGILTVNELQGFFSKYGKIIPPLIKIRQGSPDHAFINFSSCESAAKASKEAMLICKDVCLTVTLRPSLHVSQSLPCQIVVDVKHNDKLVSLLLTKPPYLQEAKGIGQQHHVGVQRSINGGLQLYGSEKDTSLAKSGIIDCLAKKIMQLFVSEATSFPCWIIPLFDNQSLFHEIEKNHLVQLTIAVDKRNEPAKETSLADFSDFVTDRLSGKGPATIDPFLQFFPENGSSGTFHWLFEDDSGSMVEIDDHNSRELEKKYHQTSQTQLTIGQWTYNYNFENMTRTNVSTYKKRKVARRVSGCEIQTFKFAIVCRGEQINVLAANAVLQEVIEKRTVQQTFVLKQNTPDVERKLLKLASRYLIGARVDKSTAPALMMIEGCCAYADNVRNTLKEAYLDLLHEDSTPAHWEPQTKECELKPVNNGTKEWNDIELKVKATVSNAQILKIERIQNNLLWKRYSARQKEIIKHSGVVNEKQLFHGTRGTDPREIYDSDAGFDMRFSAQGMWGQANYFAFNASYSNNYAYSSGGQRKIFLAMVLTGDSYQCEPDSSLRKPPKNPKKTGLANMRYDTVTGTTRGSQVYMTYDNNSAYPAYLITYT